jgi:hypothetical protein
MSVSKFELFIKLVELEQKNDNENYMLLNRYIFDLIEKERDTGYYFASVNLESDKLEKLFLKVSA